LSVCIFVKSDEHTGSAIELLRGDRYVLTQIKSAIELFGFLKYNEIVGFLKSMGICDRPEIQKSVSAVAEFPEAAVVLNQLKARRKKSKADLADIEAILGLLAEGSGSNLV